LTSSTEDTLFHGDLPATHGYGADRRSLWRDRFAGAGLPSKKLEDWRYTDLGFLSKIPFAPTAPEGAPKTALPDFGGPRLVFVNGRFAKEHSRRDGLPEGITVCTLEEAAVTHRELLDRHLGSLADGEGVPMAALNGAHFTDAIVVHARRDAVMETPLEVVFVTDASEAPVASHVRGVVVAEDNSRVALVETVIGGGEHPSLHNGVLEVIPSAGARVERARIQLADDNVTALDTVHGSLPRDATFVSHDFEVGGKIGRSELRVSLDGPGAELDAGGLALGTGDRIADHFVLVDHRKPHGTSNQFFRGVFDDSSVGVFNGKVIVREGADQADAQQSDKNLVLSADAQANTRPQLEIYADEVKASHGATVGQLDQASLFYLRSRGIPLDVARNMLTQAFASEVLARLPWGAVRTFLEERIIAGLRLGGE
jgi:Fe-S cluster assembly protein SufD